MCDHIPDKHGIQRHSYRCSDNLGLSTRSEEWDLESEQYLILNAGSWSNNWRNVSWTGDYGAIYRTIQMFQCVHGTSGNILLLCLRNECLDGAWKY
jgi:hypothetical protein